MSLENFVRNFTVSSAEEKKQRKHTNEHIYFGTETNIIINIAYECSWPVRTDLYDFIESTINPTVHKLTFWNRIDFWIKSMNEINS